MSKDDLDLENRFVTAEFTADDMRIDNNIRPRTLEDYIGQEKVKENLAIYIQAANERGEQLDHVLLYGPPGLGKTTLAKIISNELNSNIREASGPAIDKKGEAVALLTTLEPRDVLFIDEIHRLSKNIEEVFYPAMEDFTVDIITGEGAMAPEVHMTLNPFTLIGATTRSGQLTAPLRDRFGIILRLEFYTPEELCRIVKRSAGILNIEIDHDGAMEIASRSRGTPRIANRFLKRVRDVAQVMFDGKITKEVSKKALDRFGVDDLGLDDFDRRLLEMIIKNYNGGPVGLETLGAALGEESVTIEDVYEPYLMQLGFLARTPRGRCATSAAYEHLNIEYNGNANKNQMSLSDMEN